MKLTNQAFLITLSEDVQIGELKVTLVAQAVGEKDGFDIEYVDTHSITYMGIPIEGYQNWKKFRDCHKEIGIDFDAHLQKKFDEIFTVTAVKKLVNKVTS